MPWLSVLLLVSAVLASGLAGALWAGGSGQRANRLVALVLVCSAFWSLCELIWNSLPDPEWAARIVRLSSLGWMWMGPLALHVYTEIANEPRSLSRRLLPHAYGVTLAGILMYVTTPWGVERVVPVGWGFGIVFGPLFLLAYLPSLFCVGLVLLQWPRFFARGASEGERRLAVSLFVGIAVSMSMASITDVLFPYLGIHVPRLGSTSLLFSGALVAWSVSRHGYFLIAPGAFASEILETLRDGVALFRTDGSLRACNTAFAGLVGFRHPSLVVGAAEDFFPGLSGESRDREFRGRETALVPSEGARLPVSLSASRLLDDHGSQVGRVLAVRDLREVAALRDRLVTSGRLAAVGELAAGIAHEINNPIGFVRANLTHLRQLWEGLGESLEKGGPDEERALDEGREILEESLQGIDRVSGIIRDVRAFSHAGLGHTEMADVNELVENAANVAALRYAIRVERCYAELPQIPCAPHQLRQLFLNLIVNALQAVDEQGSIRIVTQRAGDQIEVRIQDDGCGIDREMIDRVFDPFFTTRPAGEGTGLGLALCYQIARNHRGEILLESQPGAGTLVRVRLPCLGPEEPDSD